MPDSGVKTACHRVVGISCFDDFATLTFSDIRGLDLDIIAIQETYNKVVVMKELPTLIVNVFCNPRRSTM